MCCFRDAHQRRFKCFSTVVRHFHSTIWRCVCDCAFNPVPTKCTISGTFTRDSYETAANHVNVSLCPHFLAYTRARSSFSAKKQVLSIVARCHLMYRLSDAGGAQSHATSVCFALASACVVTLGIKNKHTSIARATHTWAHTLRNAGWCGWYGSACEWQVRHQTADTSGNCGAVLGLDLRDGGFVCVWVDVRAIQISGHVGTSSSVDDYTVFTRVNAICVCVCMCAGRKSVCDHNNQRAQSWTVSIWQSATCNRFFWLCVMESYYLHMLRHWRTQCGID